MVYDAAIVPHTLEDINEICKHFEQAATLFGLKISTKKTVKLYQPPSGQISNGPHIEICGTTLKSVNFFTYMGNTIAFDNTIDVDINNRIRAASGSMVTTWHYNLHKVPGVQGDCTTNTTVLS